MLELDVAPKPHHAPSAPRTTKPPGKLDISILGPLTIRRGTETLGAHELGGPKPRQILEILLLHLGAPVSKGRLIDLLWEGQAPAAALPTLESHVSVLRRHLQPGTGRAGPLKTVTGGYMMDRARVSLDLDRFDVLFRLATQTQPRPALSLLTEALALAHAPLLDGELLPAWAEEERAMHAARVVEAKVLAAQAACSLKDSETAIAWATAALEDDVLAERAWTVLVLGLERAGQLTAALRAFDRCRHVMDQEMACAPGPVLQAAHARLLQCTATREAEAPVKVQENAGSATSGRQDSTADEQQVLTVGRHSRFELLTAALDREPDLQSVGTALSVDLGVKMRRVLQPHVVIVAYRLPDGTGLDAARMMLLEAPETKIVMLAAECTLGTLCEAAALGVCAFLPQDGPMTLLLDTLRHAKTGNMLVHPSIVARLAQRRA